MANHDAPKLRRKGEALPAGHLIGKFELRDTVSTGPTGIVYRGWDRDLGMAVAVAEHWPAELARRSPNGDLAPLSAAQEGAYAASLRAFVHISRALAHCDHASLVRVLQLEFAHGTAYRVMPWIDGEPLHDARRRQIRPPEGAALHAWLDALLGAVEALHAAGGVHGGIEPGRILLQRDGRPMLLSPPTPRPAEAGSATEPWTDVRDLAEVLRFWIHGPPAPASRTTTDEPSAAVLESLALHDRRQTLGSEYGEAFLRVVDSAVSAQGARRMQSISGLREQLREAMRVDSGSSARPALPMVVPPVLGIVDRDLAIASAPPIGPQTPPPVLGLAEHDPERAGAPPIVPKPVPPLLGSVDRDLAPEHVRRPPRPPRRRRGGAMAAVVLLGAAGLGAGLGLWSPAPAPAPQPVPVAEAPQPAAPLPPAATPTPPPAPVLAAPAPAPNPPPSGGSATPTGAARPDAAPAPTRTRPDAKPPRRSAAAAPAATSPRQVCGARTEFSLYRCMQQQCERAAWVRHPQCVRFRRTDRVD